MKIDPDKMTKTVRHLYELSLVKNLSPERLEPLVGISHMTIYRWYRGAGPSGRMEEKILAGIERIKVEVPDSNWGRRWNRPMAAAQEKRNRAREDKVDAIVDKFLHQVPATTIRYVHLDETEKLDDISEFLNLLLMYTDVKIRIPDK